jgi:hypothetical protein
MHPRHVLAIDKAVEITTSATPRGWVDPVNADTGNQHPVRETAHRPCVTLCIGRHGGCATGSPQRSPFPRTPSSASSSGFPPLPSLSATFYAELGDSGRDMITSTDSRPRGSNRPAVVQWLAMGVFGVVAVGDRGLIIALFKAINQHWPNSDLDRLTPQLRVEVSTKSVAPAARLIPDRECGSV